MTHIASHPPGSEDSYFSGSPLHRMFGYLRLEDKYLGTNKEFRIFFMNNTGYQFEKIKRNQYKPVGFHILLIPLYRDGKRVSKKPGYCGIAYDLVPYIAHQRAEAEVMGKAGKIENARIEFIEDFAKTKLLKGAAEEAEKKCILEQTCGFMKTESFKILYPHYKTDVNQWIRENVADFETTKKFIFGCGDGENEIIVKDFQKLLDDAGVKRSQADYKRQH